MVLKQTESSLLINLRLTSSAATKLGMKIATTRAMIIRIVYTCSIYTVLGKALLVILSEPILYGLSVKGRGFEITLAESSIKPPFSGEQS